jgi:hypothetical protein
MFDLSDNLSCTLVLNNKKFLFLLPPVHAHDQKNFLTKLSDILNGVVVSYRLHFLSQPNVFVCVAHLNDLLRIPGRCEKSHLLGNRTADCTLFFVISHCLHFCYGVIVSFGFGSAMSTGYDNLIKNVENKNLKK